MSNNTSNKNESKHYLSFASLKRKLDEQERDFDYYNTFGVHKTTQDIDDPEVALEVAGYDASTPNELYIMIQLTYSDDEKVYKRFPFHYIKAKFPLMLEEYFEAFFRYKQWEFFELASKYSPIKEYIADKPKTSLE